MHCASCDVTLTDKESCHKDRHGEYTDMCFTCLNKVMLAEYLDQYDTLSEISEYERIVNHGNEISDG